VAEEEDHSSGFSREQTELIDAGGANLIDDGDDFAILRASIALT